jgi:arylformamidase
VDFREIYDVSVTLNSRLAVWPGDPTPEFRQLSTIAEGAEANVSLLHLGAHTGTHMDAPRHFIEGASGVDKFPLEALVGTAYVLEFELNIGEHIRAAALEQAGLPEKAERVLLKTPNSRLWGNPEVFHKNYSALAPDGAEWLIKRGVKLVGIDYLSIERFNPEVYQTHHILLSRQVVVVEGLDLSRIEGGEYTLMALPLKIQDGDGAPARVLLAR